MEGSAEWMQELQPGGDSVPVTVLPEGTKDKLIA